MTREKQPLRHILSLGRELNPVAPLGYARRTTRVAFLRGSMGSLRGCAGANKLTVVLLFEPSRRGKFSGFLQLLFPPCAICMPAGSLVHELAKGQSLKIRIKYKTNKLP